MADENTQLQLVTFRLGEELYGVDIMDVKEIVRVQNVRPIPNAPYYVEGIINLRAEIIPIINLHKRFHIQKQYTVEETERQMTRLIPREKWGNAHHWLIWHGRRLCKAQRPLCGECALRDLCPYAKKNG